MKPMRVGLAFALAFAIVACSKPPAPIAESTRQSPAPLELASWALPDFIQPSAQPDLVPTADGVLLSWIETAGDAHALKLSAFDGRAWQAQRTVAQGKDWFVNWADTPHVAVSGKTWWAHWLRKSASDTYAYDVVLSRSSDAGQSWSAAQKVNADTAGGEHGFVSMWPQDGDGLGIAWLDGRNTVSSSHAVHEGHGSGAMSLRAARFDAQGVRMADVEIDARTCDCCQTAVAQTSEGSLLAYRDRDENEIRDITVTRFEEGRWTPAHKVHDDGWKMPACPVNGPAIAANGKRAWVAWYTATDDVPRVRLALSEDAGDRFANPVEVDAGAEVQGRVALATGDDAVWLAWMREDAQGQSLQLARYRADLASEPARIQVAALQGRGRATGFPQLVARGDSAFLVWTDVVNGAPLLRGAMVKQRPR